MTLPTIYVATTGNDTSGNGLITNPYKTLGKALTVPGITSGGTIYIRGGTYPIPTGDWITATDLTISSYQSELAVLDGEGSGPIIYLRSCNACTISGIHFQNNGTGAGSGPGALSVLQSDLINITGNTFTNCNIGIGLVTANGCLISVNTISSGTGNGITLAGGSNNNIIDSNSINTIAYSTTGTGAGIAVDGSSKNQVTNNQVTKCATSAISIGIPGNGYNMGNVIQYNYCPDNCLDTLNASNCGVLHIANFQMMLNNDTLIDQNFASVDSGNSTTSAVTPAVYLAEYASGCTVTNNILVMGRYGIVVQGGMNNTIRNNIIDMLNLATSVNAAGNIRGLTGFTGGSMTNNIISGNIIYSTATTNPIVWLTQSSGVATVSGNFYHNTNGEPMTRVSPAGGIYDTAKIFADPYFAGYSTGNYDLGPKSPVTPVDNTLSTCIFDGFLPINQGLIPYPANVATGATVYVSLSGVDDHTQPGAGSLSHPYATLAYAIEWGAVSPGGSILMLAGTYPMPNGASFTGFINVTIAPYLGAGVILDGQYNVHADPIISANMSVGCTIQGFQIVNSNNTNTENYGGIGLFQCQGMQVIANKFMSCYKGVYMYASSWCTISGNWMVGAPVVGSFVGQYIGISLGSGSNNNLVDSNLIDTTVVLQPSNTGTGNAGIFIAGCSGNRFTHNNIVNCGGSAIVISVFDSESYSYGNIIQHNYCNNNCTDTSNATDCGVFYIYNKEQMLDLGTLIDNNYFSVPSNNSSISNHYTKSIYLDDFASGCTVTNNILIMGQNNFQIHSGMNNTFRNNIFDMGVLDATYNSAGLFQIISSPAFVNGSFTNNAISGNLIYSTAPSPPTVYIATLTPPPETPATAATVSNNFYFNTNSQSMLGVTGNISDSSPTIANPNFRSYVLKIYDMNSASLCIKGGFTPINQGLMGLAPQTGYAYIYPQ